jgi:hypothetical protein
MSNFIFLKKYLKYFRNYASGKIKKDAQARIEDIPNILFA